MAQTTDELALIRDWVKAAKEAAAHEPAREPVSAAAMPATSGRSAVGGTRENAAPEPIAITGVAGFFPGCDDVEAFWRHLDRDEALLTPIPAERFSGNAPKGWGGFIPDIASFDAEMFKILPIEAEEMDPRQRLLLMSTWRTLEDAGIAPASLEKSNTGVFIACEGNEYAVLMNRAGFAPKMGFAQANSMVANRISYQFDFAGPSEMVDATCAGFSVALHRAVVALRAGLIDRALVGAANLILLPDAYGILGDAGQLSARSRVKSFGKDGDGFIRSEGVGTILIERRRDAVSAGRRVYAEIKHTAVNFNGRGGVSMASPNTEAHAAVIKACYREAGIDPRDLSYVEAQGMGSPVADIAEWTALNRALAELCEEQGLQAEPGFCRVSTLKPMLGHMHSASSLGALLKVIRSFQTGTIHQVLDFTEPNEFCDMRETPCVIASETARWETAGKRRLAAIHAYGSGGNNAHVLLEEPRENARREETDTRARATKRAFKRQRYWFDAAGTETVAAETREKMQPAAEDATEKAAAALRFIRGCLGGSEGVFDENAPFTELGLDSLSVPAFVARIEAEFGVTLRKSDVFSHATPARLANHVATLGRTAKEPVRAPKQPSEKGAEADDIAIVGVSLQVAGAENAAEFWRLLREGRSSISAIPEERLSGSGSVADARGVKGGFLADVDAFDPLFFKISPKESAAMDPRHRKLLQAAWAAIEDSGHSPDEWRGGEHGVFIGIEESDYPYDEQSAITAVHGGTAPARIGYLLDLKGPVLALSTACSSSLVAVHYACLSILSGESDCALAGGCNIISQPERTFYALSQMGNMLSPDGTCYAFDGRANGMVVSEGVGLVVLKRLSRALRDGDPIYAVIKGSGINYDGKTNGLTAPNGARQKELYERVYRQSGVEPARISYVVAHGTGTALGDPVEGNALIDAFGCGRAKQPWCALTSPKTNIGHTQAASGIVNLITAALALKHGEIPPSLNYETANGDIALAESPFYVNTTLRAWTEPQRHAAVSAFGHTGTNAHVVLANAPVESRDEATASAKKGGPYLVVLSAKSEERLVQTAKNLLGALTPDMDLAEIAYTLQVGREPMEERVGLVVETIGDLRAKLTAWVMGRVEGADVYRGQVRQDDPMVALFAKDAGLRESLHGWMSEGKHAEILKLWVSGVAVEWARFYGEKRPRRVHLPTYPFEKERYWLKPKAAVLPAAEARNEPKADDGGAMDVMTFTEEWVEAPVAAARGGEVDAVLCVLGDVAEEGAWREALKAVAPQVTWTFVSPETISGEEAGTVVYLAPRAPSQVETLLSFVKGLATKAPKVRRLVLACRYRDDAERCYADAWVALERSLKPIFSNTDVSVVGVRADTDGVGASAKAVWAELNSADKRSALYEEGGRRWITRIRPTTLPARTGGFRRGATYLITGGCGGIGYACAEHLVKNYAAKVVLVGRGEADAARAGRVETLKRLGGDAMYVAADVANAKALQAALAAAKERFGPIHGLIHAAGVESVGSLLEKDRAAFQAVLSPKVAGVLTLDAVLRDEPLEWVIYFSSSAAVLGDFGQGDYAVANRFLNAHARHRNALCERGERAGKTQVINWPLWQHGGIGRAEDERTQFYLKTSGQRALETREGLALLERISRQDETQHLVLVGQPERVRRFLGITGDGAISAERVQEELKTLIGSLLNIGPAKLRLDANLADFGFDSISLAQLAERIGARYGIQITPAVFFGHSTIRRLSTYLVTEYATEIAGGSAAETVASVPTVSAPATGRDEPIAIIGMSGRFPQARTIDEMWRMLAEGRDAVTEIPAERFDWREFYGDPATDKTKSNGKWMGCLPGVAEFDPLFFEISPREAETMDPRQRHLLQESWKALENAGYGPGQLAREKIGMFVGVEEGDYGLLAPEGDLTANSNAILASRLAYLLDFKGPVLALNTACSSGLVAAHQACASLRAGECDAALVAAVSLQLTPAGHVAMGQAGMLSADGKCFVFDKRANGLVPGEAAVALVLKRLSRAEADGDPIHAVIRASGVNYDGKTNGITAPNGVAQEALLSGVYEQARIAPEAIEYVVAHGTGTRLGDPVEVNALHRAFKRASSKRGYCALTSTKSNFGHTFAASGLVGAVSLVEALRHELIPPTLHCEQENDYITWAESPFYVNKAKKAWPRVAGKTRLGAVSAFGMSGTNAHMVIAEYVGGREGGGVPELTFRATRANISESGNMGTDAPGYLMVVSAKTEEALGEQIDALVRALRTETIREAGLARVSYTLLEGRHHFTHRVAIVARDLDEAVRTLEAVRGKGMLANVWRGRTPQEFEGEKARRSEAEALITQSRARVNEPDGYRGILGVLAERYCEGYVLTWRRLFGEPAPRRVALPGYSFARETYWVEARKPAAKAEGVKWLHPLVQVNASTLDGQRFTSRFTGTEMIFAEHLVRGERVFPGAGYLEMARAALELSTPADARGDAVWLRQVVWLSPLVAGAVPTDVRVEMTEEDGRVAFEVGANGAVTHAKGWAAYEDAEDARVDVAKVRARMTRGRLEPEGCYEAFRKAGMEYGPSFRGLSEVWLGEGEVLARIRLPEGANHGYGLHPCLIDSAFQATLGLQLSATDAAGPRIPFALESLRCEGPMPAALWVWARGAETGEGVFDLDLVDDDRRVRVAMRGFATRPAAATAAAVEQADETGALEVPRILSGKEFYLGDHGGVLPGVVSLEWARAAGRLALGRAVRGLKNVVWNQPLKVAGEAREVRTTLEAERGAYAYRVSAGEGVHAQGLIVGDDGGMEGERPRLALAEIRARCATVLPTDEFETRIDARLGPGMRSVVELSYNAGEALATLRVPACIAETAGDYVLHPSVLNGALQACGLLARATDAKAGALTPFGIAELRIHAAIPTECVVHVKKTGAGGGQYDLVLADEDGRAVVTIRGYTARAAKTDATETGTLLAVPCWVERTKPTGGRRDVEQSRVFILTKETAGLRTALEKQWPGARVIVLAEGDSCEANFGRVVELIQGGLREDAGAVRRVVLLASDEDKDGLATVCAALFRTVRLEQSRVLPTVVRLKTNEERMLAVVEAEVIGAGGEAEVRLGGEGKREGRSIEEERVPATHGTPGGVVWITGGLGGVGRAFARHYAVEGKARVFLSGRSALDAEKEAWLGELRAKGAELTYLQGDVAEPGEAARMVAAIVKAAVGLTGIIHSAGVIEDGYLRNKSPETMARVWRPKVAGALALDAATRGMNLDFFAVFSSLTGSFGNAGQADYAGANAFLDWFAAERNRRVAAGERRGRTVSIAWPLWRDGGMAMDPQTEILMKQRSGMTPMETARGIEAFQRALASDAAHVLVLHGDVAAMRTKLFAREEIAVESGGAAKAGGPLLETVEAELRAIVAEQQKIAPERIELDVELPRYGFDSIRLTELANRINKVFSLELMPTLFFEHTTVRAIARHLVNRHAAALRAKQNSAAVVATPRVEKRRRAAGASKEETNVTTPAVQPIAIVGVSGRFPGAENVREFWRHVEANRDLISEVPADRWDWREYYGDPSEEDGKTKVKNAGFMDGIDRFDAGFFGISPREAISMDPQFRLLLETVWATIEDAGYRAGDLSGTKTGVFIGVSTSDYKDAWMRNVEPGAKDGPALVSHFVVANRISYILNLHGPSEPIDTACSSSLIAIHRAIEAMRQGNCEQALVGGVNVICTPDIIIGASRAGMLSEDGRCKTFDRRADGYGRGEGVGALLLKPLDAALRDGDHVYALVRGSAENHGGRAQSPTAPNPAAQRELLVSAYTRAGVDPRTVGYLEAHGTGTSLGDPIEIDGLRGAFEALYQKAGATVSGKHCALGSVKTNVGHLEAAAGMAGVMKVVMMLRHRKIPGNVHLHEPNPYLQLDGTPFYLARETTEWAGTPDARGRVQPRRAGVSSFGIGGSNAHVILEEYAAEIGDRTNGAHNAEGRRPEIVVLSAKKADRLATLAGNLRDFLVATSAGERLRLEELAYTLQVGREAFEERVGFVVSSLEELTAQLGAFVDGRGEAAGVYRGSVARKATPVAINADGDPQEVLAQWVRGAEVNWRVLWSGVRRARVSLPTYPFARNRYWFDDVKTDGTARAVNEPEIATVAAETSAHTKDAIEMFLVGSLAKILFVEPDAVARESSFVELGLDSVLAVEWIHVIKTTYGIKIPATKVYDYPTVGAFAEYLAGMVTIPGDLPASAAAKRTETLSLDEILEQVRTKRLTVEEAEQLIDDLSLENVREEKGSRA